MINRCTEYAVLSLLRMAEKRDLVSAQELARNLNIPHPFLRGILRTLKEHGIIGSHRGQKGGFLLNKEPGEISLLEIVTVFQGPFKLTECADTQGCPRLGGCSLRRELEATEEVLVKHLRETTLRRLLERENETESNGFGRKNHYPLREKEHIC